MQLILDSSGAVPSRSAALQQLLDIRSGLASGMIDPAQAETLLQELENYLTLEREKFVAYPSFDFEWPDYEEGLEEVIGGLDELTHATLSAAPWSDRVAQAEAGNQRVVNGLAMLREAHQQAQQG